MSIIITLTDDEIFEGIETFGASISIPSNPITGLQLGERTFNGQIIDNDGKVFVKPVILLYNNAYTT